MRHFLTVCAVILSISAFAVTWNSNVTNRGDWNAGGTWDNATNISNFNTFDVINILNGDTITLNGNLNPGFSADINILAGGMLIVNGNLTYDDWFQDFSVAGGLLVNGNVTVSGKANFLADGGYVAVLGDMTVNADNDGEVTDTNGGDIFVLGQVIDNGCTSCGGLSVTNEDNLDSAPQGMQDFIQSTVNSEANTTLPVVLVEQEAVIIDDGVRLSWSTASEWDNDYFLIEKSLDGKNFEVIAKIDGSGTTYEFNEYSFIDNLTNGQKLVYYQLVQVDFDGANERFPKLVVKRHDMPNISVEKREIEISPNPSIEDRIRINYIGEQLLTEPTIQIIDIYGKVLFASTLNKHESNWEIENVRSFLSNNIYFLIFQSEQTRLTKRLIIK